MSALLGRRKIATLYHVPISNFNTEQSHEFKELSHWTIT